LVEIANWDLFRDLGISATFSGDVDLLDLEDKVSLQG
jgi:hypothetical protein